MAKVTTASRKDTIQARRVKWPPSPSTYALPTAQATTRAAAHPARAQLLCPVSARWTAAPRNEHHGGDHQPLPRRDRAIEADQGQGEPPPPSRPPNTLGTADPVLAQQMATTITTAASAMSRPVPSSSENTEAGSVNPAATLSAASTARVTATAPDRRCCAP